MNIYQKKFSLFNDISTLLGYGYYSWYVEMYIGLFLIIPFLNLIFNGCDDKGKKILVITALVTTTLPTLVNTFVFNAGLSWFKNPALSTNYMKIIPQYWVGIWPLTYYFIGAYIREYRTNFKLSKIKHLILFIACLLVSSAYNVWRSSKGNFASGIFNDWVGFTNVIDSVVLFTLLLKINLTKLPQAVKKIILFISNLTFGIYLLSVIPYTINYASLNKLMPTYTSAKLLHYIKIVPENFLIALLLSFAVNLIYWIICKACGGIHKKLKVS